MWKIKLIFSIVFPALDVECRWCINMVLGESLFFFKGAMKLPEFDFCDTFKVCWLFPQLWRLTERRKILKLLCKDASLLFFFFLHTDYRLSVCASVKMWQMKYRKFSHSGQQELYPPQGWTKLILSNSSYFYSIIVEVLLLFFELWMKTQNFLHHWRGYVYANPTIYTIYIPYLPGVNWYPANRICGSQVKTKVNIALETMLLTFSRKINVHLKKLEPSVVCPMKYIFELISHYFIHTKNLLSISLYFWTWDVINSRFLWPWNAFIVKYVQEVLSFRNSKTKAKGCCHYSIFFKVSVLLPNLPRASWFLLQISNI